MPGPLQRHGGGIAFGGLRDRQQVENPPVAYHQRMVFEHPAARIHWHDPTGFDAQIGKNGGHSAVYRLIQASGLRPTRICARITSMLRPCLASFQPA